MKYIDYSKEISFQNLSSFLDNITLVLEKESILPSIQNKSFTIEISGWWTGAGSQHYIFLYRIRGQQHFCLTRGRIFCPKPQAEGNRAVRGSNKIAVVREASPELLLFIFIIFKIGLFHWLIKTFVKSENLWPFSKNSYDSS